MLKSLQKLIEQGLRGSAAPDGPRQREHAVQVATAALLVELARADFREDVVENEAIFDLLRRHFALSAAESEALMQSAEQEADAAVSLHGFTRLLNDELDAAEKARVVELLWRVGFADKRLHRYEDHLVRKVAELLYVPHSEVVRLRHQAEQAMRGSSATRE